MSGSVKVLILVSIVTLVLLVIFFRLFRGSAARPTSSGTKSFLQELSEIPVGIQVTHTPLRVVGPHQGPNKNDWTYRWIFKTEVRPIDRDITITHFGILAWDGSDWVLDGAQKEFNSGILEQNVFLEWYGLQSSTIGPQSLAVDEQNWAGSMKRAPFKQKWFFVGKDASGAQFKGEGVVEFLVQ